jgi:integration host factor subunit beta
LQQVVRWIDQDNPIIISVDHHNQEPTMNKLELIQILKETQNLSKQEAARVVELFFGSMSDALAKGDRIEIRGLCSFYAKEYKSFTGRNPKSGKTVTVKAKRLPFFKAAGELKARVDR